MLVLTLMLTMLLKLLNANAGVDSDVDDVAKANANSGVDSDNDDAPTDGSAKNSVSEWRSK